MGVGLTTQGQFQACLHAWNPRSQHPGGVEQEHQRPLTYLWAEGGQLAFCLRLKEALEPAPPELSLPSSSQHPHRMPLLSGEGIRAGAQQPPHPRRTGSALILHAPGMGDT